MTQNFVVSKDNVALLVVDVQERLFPHVERSCEIMQRMQLVIKGFQILQIPIRVSEQYPKGLGHTMGGLKDCFSSDQIYFSKTSFSCLGDPQVKSEILQIPASQWILIGIEAHICVLQTAKDLLAVGKQVVVLNDAISSRSIYDFSTAIAEMRDCGIRVSSVETILFELLRDATTSEFKAISQLIK
jgi:nicotinamidase-related amidase